jgi:homoserine kinase type II
MAGGTGAGQDDGMTRARGDSVDSDTTAAICREWLASAPLDVAPLVVSGFSGSTVLLVRSRDHGSCVLKSFHPGTSREHAAWVHRLAGHLRARGIETVPEVISTRAGETLVADADGTLWELCRFMPGVAVPWPGPSQAEAAGGTLARLHLAAATLPDTWQRVGPSPGVQRRIERARSLEGAPWLSRRAAGLGMHGIHGPGQAELVAEVARRLDVATDLFATADGPRTVARVARLTVPSVPLQPVLRDIWCDHLLFEGPTSCEITGIVDLHAAGIDTPATDIARLLGSWGVSGECELRSPVDRHPEAIAAYDGVRPLPPAERGLIVFLHSTSVIFGLDNWFRWVLEERRRFASTRRVLERIDILMRELQTAIAAAADAPLGRDGIVD